METGRPSIHSKELEDRILTEIATSSKSLKSICSDPSLPCVTTVLKWLRENSEFALQYARAKEEQADFMCEEMLEIADDGSNDTITGVKPSGEEYEMENKEWTNRSKLRVETRKWLASKLKPKKYSDKIDVTSGGEPIKRTVIKWGDKEIEV